MLTVTCPCGRVSQVPDEFAGRRGKCKSCGAVLQIPDPGALDYPIRLDDDDAIDAGLPPASKPTAASAPGGPAGMAPPPMPGAAVSTWGVLHPTMPGEPWYYRAIVQFAYLMLGLGALGLAVAIVLAGVLTVRAGALGLLASLPMLLGAIVGAIVVELWAALLMLAVDAARNLRVLRWRA